MDDLVMPLALAFATAAATCGLLAFLRDRSLRRLVERREAHRSSL